MTWPGIGPRTGRCLDGLAQFEDCCLAECNRSAETRVDERVREMGVGLKSYTCGVGDQEAWREREER